MTVFIGALFLSFLATLLVAVYAFRRREIPGAGAMGVMILGVSWWTLAYALQLMADHFPEALPTVSGDPLFWFKSVFVGVVLIPPGYLIFVLQYTGYRQRISPRFLLALAVFPVLTLLGIATDPWHDLFLDGYQLGQGRVFTGGPLFWFHSAYSYLLILIADILLLRFVLTASPMLRRQGLLLLLGAIMPSVANVLTITHVLPPPFQGLDLSPFGFLLLAGVMYYNIRREGFLTLMPIARSTIVDRIKDGVLVTDDQSRLVDFNPAARELFSAPGATLRAGTPIQRILPELATLPPFSVDADEELTLERGAERICLSVQRTGLRDHRGVERGRIYLMRDITGLKQTEDDLRHQLEQNERLRQALREEAIRDPLTGLFNRRWLELSLDRELARALRDETPLSLCVLDLDHFKQINDRYGHGAGDAILAALGQDMAQSSREMDVACRFGGEEFVLIMPVATAEQAQARVSQLLGRFSQRDFRPDGPQCVTFSAGIAMVPGCATDRQSLFRAADEALYDAKAAGRNRVQLYSPSGEGALENRPAR
ncbi:MAG: histidine kinase N-terminal 7TM domain-containing protein [Marinobacter sp.]|nr:histidine kinase N-terminal 7TM domain-containing protein [Marinobacter sp.]